MYPKMNWPQENAKNAKKEHRNLFSLSSLCSFAVKLFLELRDLFLQWNEWHGWSVGCPKPCPSASIRGSILLGCGWPRWEIRG
jgi:hypothetical protein